MKDVASTLRTKIKALLSGNVTYNGKAVRIFDHPPKDSEIPIVKGALYAYVQIGDISDTETPNDSDTFTHDTTMDVFVVVGFPGIGSGEVTNGIVNQVLQLILPNKGGKIDLGDDFYNVLTYLEIGFETTEQDIHKKHIKTLRYRLEIDET